ncbi:recombinase family protein [Methanobrevibacter sp.]|uniref:recombinase family protein n=1 Tax=Methanobrevibacter sp. TaxID=66852 RepID=UPI00388DD21E
MKKIRVGCMVRVSHEEQTREQGGISVDTQIEHLKKYVEEHKEMVLVDFYIDEGISADKLKQRLQFQRLLKDVQDGKIDMILFTKLDRWFRSVEKYYQVQPILEKNNVVWRAILEDYETETASGRFKVNIMLSVAQNERERTSERIKDVFQYKVKKGETLWGHSSAPYGFTVVDKKLVHDPNQEEGLKAVINHYMTYQSMRKTFIYLREEHGHEIAYKNLKQLLENPLLYGTYRDNPNFVEPYMTKEEWDKMQNIIKSKNIKIRASRNVYYFTGMIKCPCCGHTLVGWVTKHHNKTKEDTVTLSYRCNKSVTYKTCSFNKTKAQSILEQRVLDMLMPKMEEFVHSVEFKEKKSKPKVDKKKIQSELDRLNNMYLKGRISEVDYDTKYNELNDKLKIDVETTKTVSPALKKLMNLNLYEHYEGFTPEGKQALLRGIIKEIKIDESWNITDIIFL